ncbi:DNA oxidative demethylase AlkB [Deefgea rivuli]|uniref:DNA oxidative demethylase AlkB n=1 Tax=Deefgea rivuli TaxID=400948 RepID=UPI000484AB9C|nr:DNA oxidative demethylase AlkB [Deefgea rivuli]
MTNDLFADDAAMRNTVLSDGALLLRGFALDAARNLLGCVDDITRAAPFRQMLTPSGVMSVAMSNCGQFGWISDQNGYRYSALDPLSGQPWPALPIALLDLAKNAAAKAGFKDFSPNACLINRYAPSAKMGLHQDKNEGNFSAPIVSISLGLPAIFLWGGLQRSDPAMRVPLVHSDVIVFGGASRLRYHGVLTVKDGIHPATAACRINLTLRQVRVANTQRVC